MRFLVTGSSGFLGTYFIKKLIEKKIKFIGIDVKKNPYIKIKNFKKIDIRNIKDLNIIFSKNNFNSIVHFAAIPGFDDCQKNPKLAFDTNVLGTNNLIYLSKKYNIKKFIFISSFSTKNYFSKISTYGMTKFMGEQLIISNKLNYAANACIVRLSNIFGKYSLHKKSVVHQFLKFYLKKKKLLIHDTGDQKRDLIYAGEVISEILKLTKLKKFNKNIYEISKKNNISINELKVLIDQVTTEKNKFIRIKAPIGYDTRVEKKKINTNKKYIEYLNKRLLSVLNWYRQQSKFL